MREFKGYRRGINLGGWLSQCVSREKVHFDTFITEEDIRTISSWGLDHIRFPLDNDIVMTDDGEVIEEGFAYVDKCIAWCQKYNLNVILDVHKTKGYMFDDVAVPNPDLFFIESDLQDYFKKLWIELANRYGKYHDMLTFELLNEVVNPDYATKWNEIASETIGIIRKIAPDNYIIVGGCWNNSVQCVPQIDVPLDDKIVYTFHCYEPLIFTHQKAPWIKGMPDTMEAKYPDTIEVYREKSREVEQLVVCGIHDKVLDNADGKLFDVYFEDAIKYSIEKDIPLYCGEYGVLDRAPLDGTLNWYKDIHTAFEKYNIGRAAWNYKEKDFGIVDAHYAPIKEELIKLL